MYKGAEINGSFNGHNIDYIKWWLPANKTMLKYSPSWHSNIKENDYYIVERKPDVGEDGKQDLNVY